MKTVVAIVSDFHSGSTLGLSPLQVKLSEGGCYTASEYQMWLWEKYIEFWRRVSVYKDSGYKIIKVFNGDLIQGNPYGDVQIIADRFDVQEQIAISCIEVSESIVAADSMVFTLGTEAHSGKGAQSDARVAEHFACKAEWKHLLNIGGFIFDIKHAIGGCTKEVARGNNIRAELNNLALATLNNNWRLPDIVIRSHAHISSDTGNTFRNTRGIVTPCWQLNTAYSYRITSSPPDIGGVLIKTEDGDYSVETITYPIKQQEIVTL